MGDYVINVLYNIMGELEIGAMMCGIFCVPITRSYLLFLDQSYLLYYVRGAIGRSMMIFFF